MYVFSQNISQKLEVFERELKHFSPASVRQHRNYAGIFLKWCQKKKLAEDLVTYEQLLDFILAQKERYPDRQINRILVAIRHYYRVLDLHPCPAAGVHLKGSVDRTLVPLVDYPDLLEMYQEYPAKTDREKRNQVILSLVIYQGLTSSDLHRLRPNHINLSKGQIELVGSSQINRRILALQGHQIKILEVYLEQIRPRMLANLTKSRPGRKPSKVDPRVYEQLFFSQGGSTEIKSSLKMLFRKIKRTYPAIQSIKNIRATVIAQWLKTEDVRVVQYKAGHKYVSSTERYDQYNLTKLRIQIDEKHPWK